MKACSPDYAPWIPAPDRVEGRLSAGMTRYQYRQNAAHKTGRVLPRYPRHSLLLPVPPCYSLLLPADRTR